MKLEPGFYKVEDNSMFKRTCYLKVFYKDKVKMFQINHHPPEATTQFGNIPLDGFKLLKRLRRPLTITKFRCTISWHDDDGDEFETSMMNLQVLRGLLEEFPELAKAAGVKLKPTRND